MKGHMAESPSATALGARAERLDRLPLSPARPRRRARAADRRGRGRRRHVEPDDLPEGDRRGRRLRPAAPRGPRGGGRRQGGLPSPGRQGRPGRLRPAAAGLGQGPGRLRVDRGRPELRLRHRGDDLGGAAAARARRPAELLREDPGHRAGPRGDRGDDLPRPQHQRHADLLPGALRRGRRGLPARAGAARRGRGRSVEGRVRGELLRLARRHRGRPQARGERRARTSSRASSRSRTRSSPIGATRSSSPASAGKP